MQKYLLTRPTTIRRCRLTVFGQIARFIRSSLIVYSSTQCPTLPSWPSIQSFTWWGLETSSWSSWSSSCSLDRPTLQRHWIPNLWRQAYSTGLRRSDVMAWDGYAMTTTCVVKGSRNSRSTSTGLSVNEMTDSSREHHENTNTNGSTNRRTYREIRRQRHELRVILLSDFHHVRTCISSHIIIIFIYITITISASHFITASALWHSCHIGNINLWMSLCLYLSRESVIILSNAKHFCTMQWSQDICMAIYSVFNITYT